jgi:putative peptidoglycan lipid II flippase
LSAVARLTLEGDVPEVEAPDANRRERARETRAAAVVAVAILLSRLAGLVRQRVTAHFFGTGLVADVIAAAFRIGNLAQNLLGEGTLSASFIPIYAKLRAEGRDAEAMEFARAALGLLSVAVVVVSALGVALAPYVSLLFAAGFDADKLDMTAGLVRILFPMTGLLVLSAWALGVLNAHRRFFLPYAAPVLWSAAQIAALLVGGSWLMLSGEPLAKVLAAGALVGAAINFAVLLAAVRPLLDKLRPTFDHRNAALREAARRLPSVILGRGVIQISGLIDTLLVSFVGTGANAVFAYAQMLYLLPMSLLGTGEAAVSLPEMARDTAQPGEERDQRIRTRLGATLARVTILAVPAMIVLIFFGVELITVVLRTGAFDESSTLRTAAVLRIYGLALLANASVRLFATTYFALGDTRVPARFAVVRLVASTTIALALLRPLGVVGVVTGAAAAGWIEALLLGWQLRQRLGGLGLQALPALRILVLAALTWAIPTAARSALPTGFTATIGGALSVLAIAAASFILAALLLGLVDRRTWSRR